ncbi:MAG: trypsin-like peptidase domain-containing protein, partial [Candidatus Aminicenantales bacterium]
MGKPTPLAIVICVFQAAVSSSLDQPEDVNEALKASSQSVVTLSCLDSHKKEIHRGKGVVVSAEGLVLTNYHILSGAHSAKALIVKDEIRQKVDWEDVFYPGYERAEAAAKKKKLRGRWVKLAGIVAVDRNLNLAVVRIEGKGYRPAPLSPSDRMEIGDRVFIVAEEES